MNIPLSKQLRKRIHLELAMLQDDVMDVIYSVCLEDSLVLHGGTAIWRCYNGKRFSEDMDFYGKVKIDFEERLKDALDSRGLILLKYKKTANTIFAKISNTIIEVKLEITMRNAPEKIVRHYEKTNGTMMDIHTLSAETLMIEKMDAYKGRKYIRDIYDVYYLSALIEDSNNERIQKFLGKLDAPVDEKNLKILVYSGVAPSFEQMVDALKRRFR